MLLVVAGLNRTLTHLWPLAPQKLSLNLPLPTFQFAHRHFGLVPSCQNRACSSVWLGDLQKPHSKELSIGKAITNFQILQINDKRRKEGRKEAFSRIFALASSSGGTRTFFHESSMYNICDIPSKMTTFVEPSIKCCNKVFVSSAPSRNMSLPVYWPTEIHSPA